MGLGWGRASRRVPLPAVVSPGGLSEPQRSAWVDDQLNLFDPGTTKRIVITWILTPTVAGVVAFGAFELAERLQLLA